MRVYNIKIRWDVRISDDQRRRLMERYDLDAGKFEERADGSWKMSGWGDKIVDDPSSFKRHFPNLPATIGEEVPTTQALEIINALERIEHKIERRTQEKPKGIPNKPTYESDGKERAAMPEWFIAHIRTVEVRTDYCTNALQRDLDDGWHILAICPQPGQCRPDYILGRF